MIYCVNYFDTVNMLVEFVEFVILGQIKKYVCLRSDVKKI